METFLNTCCHITMTYFITVINTEGHEAVPVFMDIQSERNIDINHRVNRMKTPGEPVWEQI